MKMITKVSIMALSVTLLGVIILSADVAGNLLAQTEEPDEPTPTEEAQTDEPTEATGSVVYDDGAMIVERIGDSGLHLYSQEAVQAGLDTAVSDNVLTQAEADKILADIQAHQDTTIQFFEKSITGMPHFEEFTFDGETGSFMAEILPGAILLEDHSMGGLPMALFKAEEEGILTKEEVDAIIEDLATLSGNNITIQRPDGEETLLMFTMEGDPESLEAAQEQALANAVANGILTQEEADKLLANSKIELGNIDATFPKHFEFLNEDGMILEEFIIGESIQGEIIKELFETESAEENE